MIDREKIKRIRWSDTSSRTERWRNEHNAKLEHVLAKLPLPDRLRALLYSKLQADGFDWIGIFVGARHKHHWTCIGTCVELYERLGIKIRSYGTGPFGLGTGILDPIVPVHFLNDPAFRLLTTSKTQSDESQR